VEIATPIVASVVATVIQAPVNAVATAKKYNNFLFFFLF